MSATATRPSVTDRYAAAFPKSRQLFEQAKAVFPGGVTHEMRALDPFPVYIDRAKGSHKWAVDGQELIDFFSGHGALLLGHCPDDVVSAVQKQMARATHPGACHEMEIEWGRLVQQIIPSAGTVRFTASGTEATLMALRLARIATGRPKVLKFMGHFHGWHDAVMPGAYQPYDGSPVPGIPEAVQKFTVVVPPNDLNRVEDALKTDPEIGTVILEPTGGHWGLVPIRGPFLQGLRELTTKYDRVLIFDEVITGFRVAPGGAQQAYGVTPDMTTLAKILAGGLPGGCVTGRPDLLACMERRPGKPKMNHPGTFNANPLSAAAGITTLERVATGEPCAKANRTATLLRKKLNDLFAERDLPWAAYGDFSLVHLLPNYAGSRPTGDDFLPQPGTVEHLDGPKDPKWRIAFRQAMLLNGVDLPGTGMFLTAEHGEEDVVKTVTAVAAAVEMIG
jgi:glutamate-1-semialdehyde 2,1-aminomutase